jgi:charged multivesicular body protein 2A
MFSIFKTKTPQEVLRENKRLLDRSIRELERERMTVEGQVKKTMAEMKKMAKAGQEVST